MSERLRRGLAVGAMALCCLFVLEVLVSLPGHLSSLGTRDVMRLIWVAVVFGGGMGALGGGVVALVMPPLAARRAWMTTLLLSPAVVWGASHLFDGPRAQQIPGHAAINLGLVLAVLASLRFALGRFFVAERRTPWALLFALLAVFLVAADRWVLPRLYPWFHLELGLGAATAAILAASVWMPTPNRRSTIVLVTLVVLALPSLWWVDKQRPTRLWAIEHAPQLGRAVGWLRAWRARPAALPDDAAGAPVVVEWPHLGDVDLVLITVDAWRADRMTPTLTPRMHALAQGGVAFSRAYTAVPHTSFAVATLLTGRPIAAEAAAGARLKDLPTLPRVLRAEGYKTAAFYPPSAFYIDRAQLAPFEASGYDFEYIKLEYLDAARRTDQVIAFFDAERPRRAFVWVHYLEPHEPYDPHPGITTAQDADRTRYDGEVRAVDGEVGRLVDWLAAHRGRSVVAITADHGEELGDHGGRYHGTTLYEEQIRVPLTVLSLGSGPRLQPRRVTQPVGLVDLAPTLLAVADVARPVGMGPHGFAPWLGSGDAPVQPVFAELGSQRAVVEGDDKLVCDLAIDSCRLFDLSRDPDERVPRLDPAAEVVESRLRGRLAHYAARAAAAAKADPIRAIVARARQGDVAAIGQLPSLVRNDPSLSARLMVARALIDLPSSRIPAGLGSELATSPDATLSRLGRVIAARQGVPLDAHVLDGLCSDEDHALCARAALAANSVSHLCAVLPQLDDEAIALEVIDALGRCGDERAYGPLVVRLDLVRTRRQTVEALEHLGRPQAVAVLARLAPSDPYTHVRVAAAHALGVLAAKAAPDSDGVKALHQLAVEREPEVRQAAYAALAVLGQPRCTVSTTQSK